ncbi:MAG: RNA polymerase sigma factor [Polyangiaceae bacterium]|nr:RNA polymerase sigma factor [Polyangiaceae bacterium]
MNLAPHLALTAASADDDLPGVVSARVVRDVPRDEPAPLDARALLAHLYAEHSGAVMRFLKDMLGDRHLAAEGTQETFVRAFRRLSTLNDPALRVGFLFGIARNVSLEMRKARRVARGRFESDAEPDTAPSRGRSPEAHLLGREATRIVAQALDQMSEERRAALLMRADHGLSYEEIADALQISVAKARVEVFRARETLRRVMDRYEGGAQ